MTYLDALWTAIIGETYKFGRLITKVKRKQYMLLMKHWQRATK